MTYYESVIFFVVTYQRRIYKPVEHLRGRLFAKIEMAFAFQINSIADVQPGSKESSDVSQIMLLLSCYSLLLML